MSGYRNATLAYLNGISPTGRMAESEDIADMAVFPACDHSRHVNAADFVIDGGTTARHPDL